MSSGRLREGIALGTLAAVMLAGPALAQQSTRSRTAPAAQAAEAPVVLDQITVEGQGHAPLLETGVLPKRIAAFLERADPRDA